MRTPEVPDQDIIAAGEQIRKEQRRVTGFALRKELGGGNAKRLIAVWEDHLKSLGDEEFGGGALPSELEETLKELLSGFEMHIRKLAVRLNDRATSISEHRVQEVMEAAREDKEKAQAELVDAAYTVEELEKDVAYLTSERDEFYADRKKAQTDIVDLKGTIANLERDLAIVKNERDAATKARKADEKALKGEIKGLSSKNKSLTEQLRKVEAERDQMKTDVMEARTDARLRKEQMDDLMERISIEHRKPHEEAQAEPPDQGGSS